MGINGGKKQENIAFTGFNAYIKVKIMQLVVTQSSHQIDEKGRINIGRKYLPLFEHGGFITRAFHNKSLVFYPGEVWNKMINDLLQDETLDPDREDIMFYLSAGSEIKLDGQNRLSIPQDLRQRMGLEKEITIVALGTKLEIWDSEKLRERDNMLTADVISEKLVTVRQANQALKEWR